MKNIAILLGSFYYFYFSVVGIYIIFLPKILDDVGYSGTQIGIIFSLAPFVRMVLPFMFERYIQLNKKSFYIALILMLIGACSFYITLHHFYLLLLTNIVLGIGMSLIIPYIEAIALQTIKKERYGKVRLFGSIGFIIVALVLVHYITNPLNALHFLVILSLISTFFAYKVVALSGIDDTQESIDEHRPITLVKDKYLWIGLTLMQVSFGSFYNFFTIYETAHGLSMDTTIYLWSFGVVVEVAMLFFQGRILHYDLLRVLQITTIFSVLRWYLIFAYPTNLWVLYAAQSLHALSFALFHSAAISYLYHHYTNKPLAQQFFSGITYGFGGLCGALIAGYIYQYYPNYLFLSSAVFAGGAFASLVIYQRQTA